MAAAGGRQDPVHPQLHHGVERHGHQPELGDVQHAQPVGQDSPVSPHRHRELGDVTCRRRRHECDGRGRVRTLGSDESLSASDGWDSDSRSRARLQAGRLKSNGPRLVKNPTCEELRDCKLADTLS